MTAAAQHLMRVAIAVTLLPTQAATAKEVALTGPQISAAISGKYVTDEYHWGHKYFADGRVERSESGRQRTARWSVKGNRLCLLQPEISKDEPICYSVTHDGQELQYKDDAQFVVLRGVIRLAPSARRERLCNSLQMRLEPPPSCGAHAQPHQHDEHYPEPAPELGAAGLHPCIRLAAALRQDFWW